MTIRSLLSTLALAGVLASALTASGCSSGHKRGAASAAGADSTTEALLSSADVATVRRSDLSLGVPVSGTLKPGWEARLTAPLDDLVDAVLVEEGQRVARGQVLARLRSTELEPMAISAEAGLKSARADHDRMRNLFAEGAVSQRDLDAAEAQFRAAEAQASGARKRLAEATIRAPQAGVVATRSVQSGDRVGAGDPMFTVVNTSSLDFEATVPSEFATSVRSGSEVTLDVTGFAAGEVRGKVARVNATADEATRQVKVYVTVPNPNGRLVGGLYASGSVISRRAAGVLAIPVAGVRTEGDARWVMVLAEGRLAKRTVSIGLTDDSQGLIEVASGLAEGDVVVIGPVQGLLDGQLARVGGKES